MNHKRYTKNGYSLVETIVYITILTIVLGSILTTTLAVTRTYKKTLSTKQVENSIVSFSGRLQREIRDATAVNIAQSSFNTNNGVLVLDNVSDTGIIKTYKFYLNNQRVYLDIDDVNQGVLTLSGTRIVALRFEHLLNSRTEGVRWTATLESGSGSTYKTETVRSAVILRGSY